MQRSESTKLGKQVLPVWTKCKPHQDIWGQGPFRTMPEGIEQKVSLKRRGKLEKKSPALIDVLDK